MKKIKVEHCKSWSSFKKLNFKLIPNLTIQIDEYPQFMRTSELYSWECRIYYDLILFHGAIYIKTLK
jgi:hypothetical protein